jgi:hypothetical protein
MKFDISYYNELPFIVEIQDGLYEVSTSQGTFNLQINSDWYKIHTARFSEYAGKDTYVGEDAELKKIINSSRLTNYAFDNCKTVVTCKISQEHDIKDEDIDKVSNQECIEKIKSILIQNKVPYKNSEDLSIQAGKYYDQISGEELRSIKVDIIKERIFGGMNRIYGYYEALNKFIINYAYCRKFFWIQKLDENILEGTIIHYYLESNFYSSFTHAGYVPSILPYSRKYPDLEEEKLLQLKERLKSNFEIPIEDELILLARSLWYRKEYRSAIIESSAALEISVEIKLIKKMQSLGKEQQFIEDELKMLMIP